jgi:hypothetical protein
MEACPCEGGPMLLADGGTPKLMIHGIAMTGLKG